MNLTAKAISGVIQLLFYFGSVVLWCGILLGLSEGLWAPWDLAPDNPPAGTWQAPVNWFLKLVPAFTYLQSSF